MIESMALKLSEVGIEKSPLADIAKSIENKNMNVNELDKPVVKEIAKGCPIEGNGGNWDGERGNSNWVLDENYTPKVYNPDEKTFREILDKYNVDNPNIAFKDGYPDFSKISKADVQIDEFTSSREDNFFQADEKLAKEWGISPEDVSKWRKENKYTWHECEDCKTMQLVPTEIHGNISHSGGVSIAKSREV